MDRTLLLPTPAIVHGDTLRDSGNFEQAIQVYLEVIGTTPDYPVAHFKLGTVYSRLGRLGDCEASYRRALKLASDYPEAANNLGLLLADRGDHYEAEAQYRSALAANIEHFDAHINLADTLMATARPLEALYHYRRAGTLQPKSAIAKQQLGQVLFDLGRTSEAMESLRHAIELDSTLPAAWINLGRCHMLRGDTQGAEHCYRESIRIAPKVIAAWTNLLLLSNARGMDRQQVFDLHLAFDENLKSVHGISAAVAHPNRAIPGRKLRIGLVSGDFRRHSVSYFIEGPLRHLDHSQIEPWAYYNHHREDYRTEELKPLFHRFKSIYGMADEAIAEMIRGDRIDILIDLSGHTGHNRLQVFARKPAPVQVSWIGYPNTTGLTSIDYRITDRYADPLGDSERFHSETLMHLPDCFLCYTPPDEAPSVVPSPTLKAGGITFGSFNARGKIGPETLDLWSAVLEAVPGSGLILKSVGGLNDPDGKNELMAQIRKAGIAEEKVTLRSFEGVVADHLALYGNIDICLDTYPYNGTTTTCEALWMGVPVVTLAGDRHSARVGATILNNIGLRELVATTKEDFVRIVAELAADPVRLDAMRSSMRERMRVSPLLDAKAMASKFEQALREMWIRYCSARPQNQAADIPGISDTLQVNMKGGYAMSVADDALNKLTAWVALEQEDWFEDEIRFLRGICDPTWYALDVGANHGVYSLALAAKGVSRTIAFEPVSQPRAYFEQSVELNGFHDRITILPLGLSQSARSVEIGLADQSELNSVRETGVLKSGYSETVTLATIDELVAAGTIPDDRAVDFVKLDAEGEEAAILRGGLRFFCEQSPLIMFELMHGKAINGELIGLVRAMGYGIYKLIPGIACLAAVAAGTEPQLDPLTLNLFACKADRADRMAEHGQLMRAPPSGVCNISLSWKEYLLSMPALATLAPGHWAEFGFEGSYGKSLLAWSGSRDTQSPPEERLRRLQTALHHLHQAISEEDGHPAVAILGIRICSDIGMRAPAIGIAESFLEQMELDEEFPIDRPLPPAYAKFDSVVPATTLGSLLYESAIEFLIDRRSHSLFFNDLPERYFSAGLKNPEHSARLERSTLLTSARRGEPVAIESVAKIFHLSEENLNPKLWHQLVEHFLSARKA